jgi:hypothetical protein
MGFVFDVLKTSLSYIKIKKGFILDFYVSILLYSILKLNFSIIGMSIYSYLHYFFVPDLILFKLKIQIVLFKNHIRKKGGRNE